MSKSDHSLLVVLKAGTARVHLLTVCKLSCGGAGQKSVAGSPRWLWKRGANLLIGFKLFCVGVGQWCVGGSPGWLARDRAR